MRRVVAVSVRIDLSSTSLARVVSFSVAGTLLCISVAMAIDSFSFDTMTWRWGSDPLNNVIIPTVLAPPLLFLLLWKMRELAIAHREVLTAASTDSLTQCLNRRAFTAMVEGYLESLRGSGTLLVIDVDHFKSVNDSYGHDEGDKALELIADAIKGSVRPHGLVARMGGEEFSVFLPATDASGAAVVGETIRARIAATAFEVQGRLVSLSASIGGISFAEARPFAELYRAADQQMYLAKSLGRDTLSLTAA